MSKKILAMILAVVMVFGLAACGGNDNAADDTEKTALTIVDSEWYGLDTFQLDGSAGGQGFASATLFAWDAENSKVVNNVCTDWTVSEDGSTVTFNVPEGLVYSTGETVEPEDVVASIEHGQKVSPYADGYANIESMDIDGRQVTLHLSHYSSDMEYYFTADFICLIDKDELDSMSNEDLMWGCHPYGPYKLADENGYVSGSEVNLVRHDDFKCFNPLVENQGAWNFETVKFKFNVEDFTATEEIRSGDVDILMSMSKDQRLELEGNDGIELVNAAYPCINYMSVNANSPILSDIRVRQALALALDRDSMAEASDGTVLPAYSMIYDTMQCFSQEAYDYFKENLSNDLDKANALLEEAGWVDSDGDGIREKDGQKLELTFDGWESATTIEETMIDDLKKAGFLVNLETLDWNYINENIENGDYDLGISSLGWAEPILILNICYYDHNAPSYDQTYLDMVKACAGEIDPEKRIEKIRDVQMHMFENLDLIPLFGDNDYEAFRSGLKGYILNADGTMFLNDLTY